MTTSFSFTSQNVADATMLDKMYGLRLRNQIKWDRTKNL